MKYTLLAALAAVLLSASAPALADPPLGSRLGDRTTRKAIKQEREAARGAQELAQCLVDKRKQTVRSFLGSLDLRESQKLSASMSGEHQCHNASDRGALVEGVMVTFPHDIYRGMLAEWMIKRDRTQFAALPALPRQVLYSRNWYAVTERDPSIDEMATCISETAPAEVLKLLDTTPYTDEEIAIFGGLNPHMAACLRAGLRLKGNRQSVRAALADALYQRIANPPPAPAPAPTTAAKQPG